MSLKIGSLLKNLRKPKGLIQNPVSKSVSKTTNIHQSFGGIKGVNDARAAMNQARSAVVSNKPTPLKPKNLNKNNKKSQINTDPLKKDTLPQSAKVDGGSYNQTNKTLIKDNNKDGPKPGETPKAPEQETPTDHEQEKAKKPGRLKDALREVVYGLSLLPGPLQGIGAKIVDAREKRKKELENEVLKKGEEANKSSVSPKIYDQIPAKKASPIPKSKPKQKRGSGAKKRQTNIRKRQVTT